MPMHNYPCEQLAILHIYICERHFSCKLNDLDMIQLIFLVSTWHNKGTSVHQLYQFASQRHASSKLGKEAELIHLHE
jgi:hypothetical protein